MSILDHIKIGGIHDLNLTIDGLVDVACGPILLGDLQRNAVVLLKSDICLVLLIIHQTDYVIIPQYYNNKNPFHIICELNVIV